MKVTYHKVANPDGSTTITTPPILRPVWRGIRFGIAFLFFAEAIGAMIGGDWSAGGWAFLIGALWLPKVRAK